MFSKKFNIGLVRFILLIQLKTFRGNGKVTEVFVRIST